MKKLLVILFIVTTSLSFSQAKKNTSGDLIGITSITDFQQKPYQVWFQRNFDNYSLDKRTSKKLKKALKNVTIKAFMGTWCGDSRRETPKFYKLLELAEFDLKNLEMITVNKKIGIDFSTDFSIKFFFRIVFVNGIKFDTVFFTKINSFL
jgi:thiol-disulfide isomerase/thioredoxin